MPTVETVFELNDRLSGGIDRIRGSFDAANRGAERFTTSLNAAVPQVGELKSALIEIGTSVGITLGLKQLASSMITANKEIETATKKVGGLLAGLYEFDKDPAANFREGMEAATKMVEAFDDAEGEIGVDKSELIQTAQRLAPAFAGANKSIKDTTEFTIKLSDVSKQLGQNAEMSSMYVMQMLQYGMVPRRSPLFQALGVSREEMKKLTTEAARFDYLMKKLEVFKTDEMRKATTLEGTMERIGIVIGNIMEDAGKPLFSAAKEAAESFLETIGGSQAEITGNLRKIGQEMGEVIKIAGELAGFLAKHTMFIEAAIKSIFAYRIYDKIFGETARALRDAQAVAASGKAVNLGASIASQLGAAAGQLAIGAFIGWEIGTSLRQYLETTDWWNNIWEHKETKEWRRQQANELDRTRRAFDFATAEVRQAVGTDRAKQEAYIRKRYVETLVPQDPVAQALGGSKATLYGKGVRFMSGDVVPYKVLYEMMAKDLGIDLKAPPKARQIGNNIFNNARFDIKQEFAEGFDPDRIAVAFSQDLVRLGEMKMQSAYSPVGSVR